MAYDTCSVCTGSVHTRHEPGTPGGLVIGGHLAPPEPGEVLPHGPRARGPRCAGSFEPPAAAQAPSRRPSRPTRNP